VNQGTDKTAMNFRRLLPEFRWQSCLSPGLPSPVLLALLILLLNLWLNAPLFMPGELPFRGSVEGGYVSMSRFLSQHPHPWGWNPLPYCGLPVQFMYVPALPYLGALGIRLLPHVAPDTVFRAIVALATCLGPVTLFFFALHFTGSRRWALAAALAYSFLSPSYGLFPAVEKDRGIVQLPWRIQVLAKYGEGPHNTGLTLLPVALLAVYLAGKRRGYPRILLAAVLLAAIPLTNWVAAFALAISCLLLLLAAWGEPEFQTWRALAAAALAWLLACFWLTPSFVKIIFFNWPVDSFAYRLGPKQVCALAGMVAGALLIRLLFRWLHGSFYLCLATLGAFVFGWIATGFYVYGVDTIPESRRYAIEFEFFLALALVEGLRLTLNSSNQTVRLCALGSGGLLVLAGLPQLWAYAAQGWRQWLPQPPETTVEYQLARWIANHPPEGRVFASGGLRFRLNSWFDLPQVGGGFETGLRNRVPVDLVYDIRAASSLRPGHETEDTILELQALGAEYVVVHGPKSKEYYRDFVRPERLAARLQPVYHIDDDTIYALPPQPLAHLMRPELMRPEQVRPEKIADSDVRAHHDVLTQYVAAIVDPSRPALRCQWTDTGTLAITGPAPPGDVVAIQVNADPGWRATQDGHDIAITQDQLGFVVLHPSPAAATRIELRYRGTTEQRIMAAVSAIAWLASLFALWGRRFRLPTLLASFRTASFRTASFRKGHA
jgi:hypothetical protein